jgi:glyoxylase-like metal-dependent hydrolase (beta-lactamase superfamily II)
MQGFVNSLPTEQMLKPINLNTPKNKTNRYIYEILCTMKKSISSLLACFAFSLAASQQVESEHFYIEELADGVYAAINKAQGHAICNAGIVNLGAETLVFDCFLTLAAARDLKKTAEQLTGNPVRYLVNSHFHNDHVRGNQVFSEATIISTQRTRDLIQLNEPREIESEKQYVEGRIQFFSQLIAAEKDPGKLKELGLWLTYFQAIKASHQDHALVLPNHLIEDTLRLSGSLRQAILFSHGMGHTESDLVLWLPEEKILFAGDLLFVDFHPWLGDGSADHWIDYLGLMKNMEPAAIVPGHGPIGKIPDIDRIIAYIQNVVSTVEKAIADNLKEDDLAALPVPESFQDMWLWRFYSMNLTSLYQAKMADSAAGK